MRLRALSALVAVAALAGCGEDRDATSAAALEPAIAEWRWAPEDELPPAERAETATKPKPKPKPEPQRAQTVPEPAPVQQDPDPVPPPDLPTVSKDPSLIRAEVLPNGVALPPLEAPAAVRAIFEAGNTIARSPYKWGGGHGKWQDNGYDCSGSVSYALAAAGLLDGPMASGPFMSWGKPGKGKWITIYTNPGHMFMVVAGVRFDTVARGQTGSRWINSQVSTKGYVARHPPGL